MRETSCGCSAAASESGIDQAMAVVTCDRCEVWCVTPDAAAAQAKLTGLLAEAGGLSRH